ncbi:MAG: hypothetical protein Q4P13_03885 [Psychrobacter sp.]|nr:hypothetical protein [Psychrobacter sp.]
MTTQQMLPYKPCPNCCQKVVNPAKFPIFGTFECPKCRAAVTTPLLPSALLTAAILGVNQSLVYFGAPMAIIMVSYVVLVLRCVLMNKIDAMVFPLKVTNQ